MTSSRSGFKASGIIRARLRGQFCKPVLAPVMQNRWIIVLLGTVTVLLVMLTARGLIAWQCPLKATLGVAGPGCGLTRAIVLLTQGQWQASIHLHAFAPVGLGIGLLLAAGGLLPAGMRCTAAEHLASFERRTGLAAWLIAGVLIYWLCRTMIRI